MVMAIKSHTGCQSHIAKASSFCLASDLLLGTAYACAPSILSIPAQASGMWDTTAVGIS